MTSCKEFILDDVMAITAIPIADFTPGIAAWQLTPTIPATVPGGSPSGFSPVLTNAVTIGLQPATPGGILIPIVRKSGKAKDDENDSVAGRLHTFTANCEIDDRDPSVWNNLLTLERTPSHLILTFRDNTRAFVQSTQDTYHCTTDRDGSKTTVAFKIPCLMGIQMIV